MNLLLKIDEFLFENKIEVFGNERQAAAAREISKIHEECVRGTLGELVEHFTKNEPRGEFVLLVGGADEKESKEKE